MTPINGDSELSDAPSILKTPFTIAKSRPALRGRRRTHETKILAKDLSQRRTIRRPNQARQHPTNLRGSLAHLASLQEDLHTIVERR
ncbi:hypothetical protein HO173_012244 [Letharia columbiana]|uniref:Uncharacterized protein n=1 Tax=Letharia columbiana TaxID=112416 RepID=A0A8H6CPX9_9LECA|nr:uncharacterized protein HO173_012244 [Letharia columbiana]KAF6227504.1 hypothetical protein HO173_012244 [Letharia columbiana]